MLALETKLTDTGKEAGPENFAQRLEPNLQVNPSVKAILDQMIEQKNFKNLGEIQKWSADQMSVRDDAMKQAVNAYVNQIRDQILQESCQKVESSISAKISAQSLEMQKMKTDLTERMQHDEKSLDNLRLALHNAQEKMLNNQGLCVSPNDFQQVSATANNAMEIVSQMQTALQVFGRTTMTPRQIQNEVRAEISKAQLQTLKDVQIGGQAGQNQILKVIETMIQASDAKHDARVGALEKEVHVLTKKMHQKEKECENLRLEQTALKVQLKEMMAKKKTDQPVIRDPAWHAPSVLPVLPLPTFVSTVGGGATTAPQSMVFPSHSAPSGGGASVGPQGSQSNPLPVEGGGTVRFPRQPPSQLPCPSRGRSRRIPRGSDHSLWSVREQNRKRPT